VKIKIFSFRQRAGSFRFAWEGICSFFKKEHNAWIHAVATCAVMIMAWWLQVSHGEIILLVIVTGFVWVTEMMNTVAERIMDLIVPEQHPEVKIIKDIAAGAVLVAAFIAGITGLLIFIPKII
jgi:diacylglycerol kinase (ATP)